jgi:hypothetical protein
MLRLMATSFPCSNELLLLSSNSSSIAGDKRAGCFRCKIKFRRVCGSHRAKLTGHGVKVTGAPSNNILSTILSWVIPVFIFYLIWTYGFRRMAERQGFGGLMAIGKSRVKVYVETDTKVTFRDVAGVDEAQRPLPGATISLASCCSLARHDQTNNKQTHTEKRDLISGMIVLC